MKRILPLCLFVLLTAVLIAVSVSFAGGEDRIIANSEKLVEKYSGIYIDENNTAISIYAYHGKDAFLKNMESITTMGESCDLPVYLAIPPRKMDVMTLPEEIDKKPHIELFDLAEKECNESGITYIDLLPAMSEEGLYFRSDHHWTSRGAYKAYAEIITAMGETPVPLESFAAREVATDYRGSDYGKAKEVAVYTEYDTIELFYAEDYHEYVTTIVNYPYDSEENNEYMEGLYDLSALELAVGRYKVFLKGNTPCMTVKKGEGRQTVMIVRDSFALALAPFLAVHYDLVMVDPRFFPERLSEIAKRENVTAVLVVENMGTFTENTIKFTY